jgi:hypothetical protein
MRRTRMKLPERQLPLSLSDDNTYEDRYTRTKIPRLTVAQEDAREDVAIARHIVSAVKTYVQTFLGR